MMKSAKTRILAPKKKLSQEEFLKRKLIFVFPGQASQYVGMGKEFYDTNSAAHAVMDRIVSYDGMEHLLDVVFNGPDEILTRTDNVQPAITAVSIMILEAVKERLLNSKSKAVLVAAAGHSLGEYAAHYAAGNLDEKTTMELVKYRGKWMNEASQPPNPPGAMVAVMGLTMEILEDITERVGRSDLALANLNSPGQIILSGEVGSVNRAAELARTSGAKKTVMLNVSGAWHSPLMAGAQAKMSELIERLFAEKSGKLNLGTKVVANATARHVATVDELKDTLKKQITAPVRWETSVRRLHDLAGFPGLPSDFREEEFNNNKPWPLFVEIGPKNVLKMLIRGIDRKIECINIDKPDDLDELMKILETDEQVAKI